MKIYIIGPVGAGKTTLSKYLSRKLNIPNYELDCLVYDDLDNHRKRTDEEIKTLFNEILQKDDWIIEDVGRDKFIQGRVECDKIYYIKLNNIELYKRIIIRWIKHRFRKEVYNYPPTIRYLIDMLRMTRQYKIKEKLKLEQLKLNGYNDKLIILNKKQLNLLEKDKNKDS